MEYEASLQDQLENAETVMPVPTTAFNKNQYRIYIRSIVKLLVGEQLQLKWIRKGEYRLCQK